MNFIEKQKSKKLSEKRKAEREKLRKDIENLEAEIKKTETVFNFATDDYLLESAIFEQNAQKANKNYLLRLAKEI